MSKGMTISKENYVETAEKVVKSLDKDNRRGEEVFRLTTSKIRGLLSMVSEIYNEAMRTAGDKLDADLIERVKYLKMRFAYEAGRDKDRNKPVKDLVDKAGIFDIIDGIGDSKEKCIIFCRYMESIVAYHKYYGGKD